MDIFQYEIINPVTDKNKPYYNDKIGLIVPHINKLYRYFVECARYNQQTFEREYFILLGVKQFNPNCRKCKVDDYGRLKIPIKGELKINVIAECRDRGNVQIEYIESTDCYDIFQIY